MHDIVFTLGANEERVFAHKLFLISASPIFHNILTQSRGGAVLNIKINQISKNTMIEICRFAYTENVKLTVSNMFDVLHAASKFEMRFLTEKVVEFAAKLINENSVFDILENNQRHHNWQINKKCFEFVEKNHQKCLKNKSWLKVTPDLVRLILQNCKIPEANAKDALSVWGKSQGDAFDDLDEMMALVSLDKNDSDTESVVSATTGKSKRQRRKNKNVEKPAEPPKVEQPGITIQPATVHGLIFLLEGPKAQVKFKHADLDLTSVTGNIFIEEIEFMYNLFATDTDFEVKVFLMENSNRKQIYYDNVKMTESLKNYKLKGKPCMIPSGQRACIRIEFPHSEYRTTFSDCSVSQFSEKDLQIFKDPNIILSAQIIEFVYYGK